MIANSTWPPKYSLLGVKVSATTYADATDKIIAAARQKQGGVVTALPVHGVVTASGDLDLKAKINTFEIVAPDGQPVRWALNLLYNRLLPDRVYGPELMLWLCRRAAIDGIGIYLYGSHSHVVKKLAANLTKWFPTLRIVGCESPPFRLLSQDEDRETIERINASGAELVFLGLGCPRQDIFAFEHRETIKGVQVCVGAAFDFHSGNKPMAPPWMQRNSLEWLFRFVQEPVRLWRRYLVTNSIFIVKLGAEILKRKFFARSAISPARERKQ